MLERMWRKGTLLYCWWECKLVQSLWKTIWRFLKKLTLDLPDDPVISFLGILSGKDGNSPLKRHMHLMFMCLFTQLCLTLCDPMDHSPQGSSVHGILQARTLEQVAMPSSRGSSQPRDRTQVSHLAGRFFTTWATREAHLMFTAALFTIAKMWKQAKGLCTDEWVRMWGIQWNTTWL